MRLAAIQHEFTPSRLLPALTAGLASGALDVAIEISFGALIFSGTLSAYLGYGIGVALLGAALFSLVVALTSSYPGTIALPQDTAAVLLSLMAAAIVAGMPEASPAAMFATVAVAILVTTLLTGAAFMGLGVFRLGNLVRFIPYPVMGGFLAGTGWLLCLGALNVMAGIPPSLGGLVSLSQPGLAILWLPGAAFGIFLTLIQRRYRHYLLVPLILAGGLLLFYLVLLLSGRDVAWASSQGLLLDIPTAGALFQPLPLAAWALVDWGAILAQAGQIATIILLSVVSLLLNSSGVELAVNRELDLNRELRANGLANLAAGLVGSLPGYTALSLTVLGRRLGSISRLNGVILALVMLGVLLFGAPLLSLVPVAVVGGLLFYLGLGFLVEWLYDAWFRLARVDYAEVLVMLVTVAVFGPLAGVGLGVLLSVVIFIVEYSRTNVVRHALDCASFRSLVERSPAERNFLARSGRRLTILELQGYLFFGTANNLVEKVRSSLLAPLEERPRFIVLDFRQVTGMDTSAALSFARLVQFANGQAVVLVFTSLSAPLMRKLDRSLHQASLPPGWRIFSDLDHGVEWCEDQLLQALDLADLETLEEQDDLHLMGALTTIVQTDMAPYLERIALAPGQALIQQDEPPRGLYFLTQGQLTAQRETARGPVRLRSMGPGTVVGELGVYMKRTTTASVVANQSSEVYFLPIERFEQLRQVDPAAAAELHHLIVQLVGERLLFNMNTLDALRE